jgi:hypothetical protein
LEPDGWSPVGERLRVRLDFSTWKDAAERNPTTPLAPTQP